MKLFEFTTFYVL